MFSSGKQTNSCQNFCRFVGKVPGFRAGRRPAQPKIPVYKPVQTGDNSRKCARVCKQGAGLCLPTGHALHFASPRGAGPALVKLPNRPDIFRRNFPPDCSILLRVYAIIKIEHLSGACGLFARAIVGEGHAPPVREAAVVLPIRCAAPFPLPCHPDVSLRGGQRPTWQSRRTWLDDRVPPAKS